MIPWWWLPITIGATAIVVWVAFSVGYWWGWEAHSREMYIAPSQRRYKSHDVP